MSNATQTRIGISGWTYKPWRGIFYPKDLTQKHELAYASRLLNSIEINGTFYSLQRPSSFQTWHDATPDGFVFSIKGSRYITHIRRLKEVKEPLGRFFASGPLLLKEKLGPILWQLPPNFLFDAEKLDAFFRLLPRDTRSALELSAEFLGKSSDDQTDVFPVGDRPLRYAMEIRNASFETDEFVSLLRNHNVALVVADTAGKWPYGEDLTADFVYARLHGDEELYASGYTPAALDRWASRLKLWQQGKQSADAQLWNKTKPDPMKQRDIFVYFDNDVKVKSPFDAMALADRMGKAALGAGRNGPAEPPPEIAERFAERVRSHWPDPAGELKAVADKTGKKPKRRLPKK